MKSLIIKTTTTIIVAAALIISSANAQDKTNEAPRDMSNQVPQGQNDLFYIVGNSSVEYRKSDNQFKQSFIRKQRKDKLKTWLTSYVKSKEFGNDKWVGQITEMGTTSKGNGYICVGLDTHTYDETQKQYIDSIKFCTTNNEFSASFDKALNSTLIKQSSKLYKNLMNINVGDFVTFNGDGFFTQESHLDYIYTSSLTESGAMIDTVFFYKFSSIEKIK